MTRFAYDVLAIVAASIIVNLIYMWWPTNTAESIYAPPYVPPPTMSRLPPSTNTTVPTLTVTPKPSNTEPVVYVFNIQPMRVWFDKADALGYRDAILDGQPTRPFISAEKSRTVRGGRMVILKQEDGLIMVKVENTDIVGWVQ